MDPAVIGVFIPIVGTIAVFTFLTVIIVSKHRYRSEERKALYDTAKLAVEKGQPLPPEVIKAMAETPRDRNRGTAFGDLRTGAVLVAVGIGVEIFGYLMGFEDNDARYALMGLGAIPLLIGVAFIVMSRFNPNKGQP